jgi:hypothetical protein
MPIMNVAFRPSAVSPSGIDDHNIPVVLRLFGGQEARIRQHFSGERLISGG